MSSAVKIKAVIFDMFETLVTLIGKRYLSPDMAEDAGVSVDVFQRIWWESEYERSSGKRTTAECIADTLKRLGRYSDELCDTMIKKRIETKIEVFKEESLHPHVIPMLKALKEKGIKIAVISNCYDEEVVTIRNSCLFSYIDVPILSYEQGVCKPEKLIYDRCLAELGLSAGECLYVGDGGSKELYAAKDAGMHPVQCTWFHDRAFEPHIPCPILDEFEHADHQRDILQFLNL